MNDPKILVVDDEQALREILTEMLHFITPHILMAANGAEALQVMGSQSVDAVLSDIHMPVMSGLVLLSRIRESGSEVPFVILSGYGDRENLGHALRLGATDFLDKPFDRASLIRVMSFAAELGVALRNLDQQVEDCFKDRPDRENQIQKLKRAKRATIILRAQRQALVKQAAG